MRTIFTAVLLSATALAAAELPPPGTYENVVSAVYVSPEQGQAVADLYDLFLGLLSGRGIEAGAKLPAWEDFCTETETHIRFWRSYYITQDELRGFEISIPKALLRKRGGSYFVTAGLQVAEVTQHQSIKIIAMKRSPNPAVQRTGASRSAQDTNKTPSAAGSRR